MKAKKEQGNVGKSTLGSLSKFELNKLIKDDMIYGIFIAEVLSFYSYIFEIIAQRAGQFFSKIFKV